MSEIMKNTENPAFSGCDFVVQLGKARKNTKIRLLQLTDMQIIDSHQRRTPDRLRIDEINAWHPDMFDAQCGDHIRTLIAQTNPDLIFITGDIIYGSFDDKGTTFTWFCELMDSFQIPWAPVFGNHDNESEKGVAWQCEQFENSAYCLFSRGTVSGNGNYTVGIATGDELVRVLYMIDSNGCAGAYGEGVICEKNIFPDQAEWVRQSAKSIQSAQAKAIPGFMAFHIPVKEFIEAETAKGYRTEERTKYTIGVDVAAKDGDFGCRQEKVVGIETAFDFSALLKDCSINGVFTGHCHNINTCITYNGIRWVYGLKTGQYDYHIPGQLGGTLVTLEACDFAVSHVPTLAPYAPFPGGAKMFGSFFAEDKQIL